MDKLELIYHWEEIKCIHIFEFSGIEWNEHGMNDKYEGPHGKSH